MNKYEERQNKCDEVWTRPTSKEKEKMTGKGDGNMAIEVFSRYEKKYLSHPHRSDRYIGFLLFSNSAACFHTGFSAPAQQPG